MEVFFLCNFKNKKTLSHCIAKIIYLWYNKIKIDDNRKWIYEN